MTSTSTHIEQLDPTLQTLPTMYDLPSEYPEEPGLPDIFHDLQPQLLSATLQPSVAPPDQVFTGTDLNVYYDVNHVNWHKRPDWFVVVGVPKLYDHKDMRLSYVIWQEKVSPTVVVELLSPSTAKSDLGELAREPDGTPTKWEVYEQILQIPYYVIFDRYTDHLRIFQLREDRYQKLELNQPKLWIPELERGLGLWSGSYDGINRLWLRWYDADENWLPTDAERLVATQVQADRMAAKLRELGIDPDDL